MLRACQHPGNLPLTGVARMRFAQLVKFTPDDEVPYDVEPCDVEPLDLENEFYQAGALDEGLALLFGSYGDE